MTQTPTFESFELVSCAPVDEVAKATRTRDQELADAVKSHRGKLLATARRLLRDEEEARDAVQDALLCAFRAIDTFNGQAQLSTWLHRIVVNSALMRLRSSRRRAEQSIDELLPRFDEDGAWIDAPCAATSGEVLVENEQTRAMVRRCIDRLPPAYRTVLLMRDIEDWDTDETARALGVSRNAVKVRLHRARQALRTLIENESHGAYSSPSVEAAA